ncbi:Zinc metalloprotease [ANME-1 cluster archaeon GoMg2]|nr:Zinc metalloprotease [ANME-1 cluster archaeon GoMg2]
MHTSIQVGKLLGIPIKLHFTFLIILFLFIFAFANGSATDYRIPMGLGGIEMDPVLRYSLATLAAVLFFFTLLLHEMAHSYVAMKFGTKIQSITLFFFGGLAMMEEIPKSPEKEWRIAIAGPLMSFAIGTLFYLVYIVLNRLNLGFYRPIGILVLVIGSFNIVLAIFNLIPAFPMDGGRVLRAVLAKRMSFLKATKKAVLIGKIFAGAMVIAGLFFDPFTFILTGERGMNLWLPLLALFLYMAATEEERATITFATLEGIRVKNVMRTERASVSEDMSIMELMRKMLEEKTAEYAVVNESGDLKGFVTLDAVKKIPAEQRHFFNVSNAMSPFDSFGDVILGEEQAAEALKRMIRDRRDILAVREEVSGNFVGVITRRDLALYIEMLRGNI